MEHALRRGPGTSRLAARQVAQFRHAADRLADAFTAHTELSVIGPLRATVLRFAPLTNRESEESLARESMERPGIASEADLRQETAIGQTLGALDWSVGELRGGVRALEFHREPVTALGRATVAEARQLRDRALGVIERRSALVVRARARQIGRVRDYLRAHDPVTRALAGSQDDARDLRVALAGARTEIDAARTALEHAANERHSESVGRTIHRETNDHSTTLGAVVHAVSAAGELASAHTAQRHERQAAEHVTQANQYLDRVRASANNLRGRGVHVHVGHGAVTAALLGDRINSVLTTVDAFRDGVSLNGLDNWHREVSDAEARAGSTIESLDSALVERFNAAIRAGAMPPTAR
jgi:hypothetical protein